MLKFSYIIIVITIFHTLQSCKSTYPIVLDNYSFLDTIVVKNYIFQQVDNRVFNSPQDVADSAMILFKEYVSKLELPINFEDTLINKTDYFYLRESLSVGGDNRNLYMKKIIDIASEFSEDKLVLVPCIELQNFILAGTAFSHFSIVKVAVFFVRNRSIVYANYRAIKTELNFTPNREDIKKNLNTLEDWEKAINGAMKEYINRLE